MEINVMQVPSLIELTFNYDNKKKQATLYGMYQKYCDKANELPADTDTGIIEAIRLNVKDLEETLSTGSYLGLKPWELREYLTDVRNAYGNLTVEVERQKRQKSAQDKYLEQIEEKIDILAGLEKHIKENKDICSRFDTSVGCYYVKHKNDVLADKYTYDSCQAILGDCDDQIAVYLGIINSFKNEDSNKEQAPKLGGIDAVIEAAKDEGTAEKQKAAEKVQTGLEMFAQLKKFRNADSGSSSGASSATGQA